jgi:hypothetical protein
LISIDNSLPLYLPNRMILGRIGSVPLLLASLSCFRSTGTTAMTVSKTPPVSGALSRLVFGKDDALFGWIEEQQEGRDFGKVLDAGTGLHSIRWLATLELKGMVSVDAITADRTMQKNVQQEVDALGVSHLSRVLIGNWFPDSITEPDQNPLLQDISSDYDVILADYLIGAMDGFSPYKQDQMISQLVGLLKPGGRLYVVGLQPIPDKTPGNDAANVICRVRQARDACILLAGHRCYREYPVDWVQRQVEDHPDLELLPSRQFPILYRHETICKQIQVGRSKFKLFRPELVSSMGALLDDLEKQSFEATSKAPNGKIQLGFDYVVTAEKRF